MIMIHRTNFLLTLFSCFSFVLFSLGIINSAYAEQNTTPNIIHGKVTDIIETSGYTYAEVDTGKKKVWAAGPNTPLKIGDMIGFSTRMPMKNFHSKSMKRDFPIIYFVDGYITDKESSASKAEGMTSMQSQIKQKQVATPVKGIHKVKDGHTIAEVHAQKQKLSGKTIRLRGKVTRFTPQIMGKNWLHIKDSSTADDLTVTTHSTVAVDDIVIIEGKLTLDKDYNYGYFYPVLLEDAKVTKE